MNKNLQSSVVDLIKKIDGLKSEIDKFHPLPKEVEDRILQKYRLDWNYNSNAIEGNTLNYGETYAFLMHGITAHGKPLKDYLDIRGHNEAINYLIDLVRNKEELTEAVIRELHKVILVESYETDALTQNGKLTKKTVTLGAYKTVPNHVKTSTGEMHYFASPEETPAKMYDLMSWYRKSKSDVEIHPVILAAIFHHRFSEIHPFDDGNGRIARLLMNLILMQNNFPPAIIKIKDRNKYYLTLSQADAGDSKPFIEYVSEALIHSMKIYLKGAHGESIDEPDDLDKEIHLLKKEIEKRPDKFEKYNSYEVRIETIKKTISPLVQNCCEIINKVSELFAIKDFEYNFFLTGMHSRARSNLTELSISQFEYDISSLKEEEVQSIWVYLRLKKFKTRLRTFDLSLRIYVRFNEFDFEVESEIDNRKYNDIISYDVQMSEDRIQELKKLLSKGIIDYIKTEKTKSK